MSNNLKIKKWIRGGHDDYDVKDTPDTDTLLEHAAGALDSACSWDIMGEIVFEGEDGKTYVGCVEFHISEGNPEYIKEVMEDYESEQEVLKAITGD
jgi:secreted trypsin-like serine protease